MKLNSLRGEQREPREPLRGRGNLKININISMVPLVPLVPSIIPRACRGEKKLCDIYEIFLSGIPLLCKIEGTEGTKGTRALQILVFRFPLISGEGTKREPKRESRGNLSSLEVFL